MSNIKGLRQRKSDQEKALRALLNKAKAEDRVFTEAEETEYQAGLDGLKATVLQLAHEDELQAIERGTPVADAENATGMSAKTGGFASLGQQLQAVAKHALSHGSIMDPRLMAANGLSEAIPSDGGFLVQKDFSAELIQRIYDLGEVAKRVRKIPISGTSNGIKINAIDEDSRVDGSRWGGVLAYWVNEAANFTKSKPKFRQIELQTNKLIALCYATDELMEDAVALQAVIQEAFSEEMTFKTENAIINGTGSGQPLGILNAGATLQIAKDSGDSGATVDAQDLINMYSRMWPRSRASAAWLINIDVEPKLYNLTLGSGSGVILSDLSRIYVPPGNNNNAYGMILGKPVIPVEYCATLGTPGDIILADLSQYLLIDKGAPKQDYSIHVQFLTDEGVYRFVYRVDGQPSWKKPLTPFQGSNTLSPFITLATRS
jgi:HK97 family phage major capsid protein